jgi:NitT/TauT family transport system substrate-binding protein
MLLVAGLALAACRPVAPVPATQNAATLTPVKVGVGFIPNVQFAAFYVAMDQGFFADEGLEVSLEYGFENDYLKLVGVNELQFMIGSGDQVILGRAQGLPVVYVANWYARYPVVLFAKADAGIDEPTDLAGKRIGIPGPFGANYVAYRALLEAGGLTEADVQTESIGFTQAAAVSEGAVDAAVDYAVSGPVILTEAGEAIVTIGPDNYFAVPANGLVTNERTLAENPELVRGMAAALLRGIAFALENPDEAFAIALATVPEAGGENEAINRAVFDATLEYWRTPEGRRPGATEAADWEAAAALMQRIGLVETVIPAEELFTNDYLP